MSCFPFPERKEFDSAYQSYVAEGHQAQTVRTFLEENKETVLKDNIPLTLHINVKSLSIYSARHGIRKDHTILCMRIRNRKHSNIPSVFLPINKHIPTLLETCHPDKKDVLRHFFVGNITIDETLTLSLPITAKDFLEAYLTGDPYHFTLDILGYLAPYSDTNYHQTRKRLAFAYFALSPVMITRNQAMVSCCEVLSDPMTTPLIANRYNTFTFGQRYRIHHQPVSSAGSEVIGRVQVLVCFSSALLCSNNKVEEEVTEEQ